MAAYVNPFSRHVVHDPWEEAEADVPEIHARPFDLCRRELERVRTDGRTRSIMLHGSAGSGKTHLLARLRAAVTRSDSPGVVFSAVRLQSGPRMVSRHTRACLVNDLLRRDVGGRSQLQRVLLRRFEEYDPEAVHDADAWISALQADQSGSASRKLEDLLDRLDEDHGLGRNLSQTLAALLTGRHRRDARAWLRGESVPDDALRRLGIEDPLEEDPEEEALTVMGGLSRLAGAHLPIAICFDQIEALRTHPNDIEGLFSFGRMASMLHDRTPNLLLITCVQSAFVETLKAAVRQADYDRLASDQGVLNPLTWDEAKALVFQRLNTIGQLAQERVRHDDALWPLGTETVKRQFDRWPTGPTPRRLIAFCRDRFDQWQFGDSGQITDLESFLGQRYAELEDRAKRRSDPANTDQTLVHGLPLLLAATGHGQSGTVPPGHRFRDVDLVLEGDRGQVSLSVCHESGNRLTSRLQRLRHRAEANDPEDLLVVRDPRLPISRTAARAREHWEALTDRQLRPSSEALAALDAVRQLLSAAKAGDLAQSGETIDEERVRDWLVRNLSPDLDQLLAEVLPGGEQEPDGGLLDDLVAFIHRGRVAPLEDAAQELGSETATVETCLQRHPDAFGVLAGPPKVIFEWVPDPVEGEEGGRSWP